MIYRGTGVPNTGHSVKPSKPKYHCINVIFFFVTGIDPPAMTHPANPGPIKPPLEDPHE
jgi:hypothetical protein